MPPKHLGWHTVGIGFAITEKTTLKHLGRNIGSSPLFGHPPFLLYGNVRTDGSDVLCAGRPPAHVLQDT